MTRRTTRIAGLGAGALLALGIISAAPAGASDGAQADATAQVETADVINQTLDLVNQACIDATRAGGTATSALATEQGITVAARQADNAVDLNVSLPALTESLPSLDLPLLGSLSGQADTAEPLKISCAISPDGAGLGLSAAGADVLVDAIAPGVDVSDLNLDIPAVDASASASTSGTASTGNPSVSATAAGSVPAKRAAVSGSVRTGAAAPATTTTTSADATAAPASSSPSVSGGTLARTGAGVGGLGLLGAALLGSGRLMALGRKLLRIG